MYSIGPLRICTKVPTLTCTHYLYTYNSQATDFVRKSQDYVSPLHRIYSIALSYFFWLFAPLFVPSFTPLRPSKKQIWIQRFKSESVRELCTLSGKRDSFSPLAIQTVADLVEAHLCDLRYLAKSNPSTIHSAIRENCRILLDERQKALEERDQLLNLQTFFKCHKQFDQAALQKRLHQELKNRALCKIEQANSLAELSSCYLLCHAILSYRYDAKYFTEDLAEKRVLSEQAAGEILQKLSARATKIFSEGLRESQNWHLFFRTFRTELCKPYLLSWTEKLLEKYDIAIHPVYLFQEILKKQCMNRMDLEGVEFIPTLLDAHNVHLLNLSPKLLSYFECSIEILETLCDSIEKDFIPYSWKECIEKTQANEYQNLRENILYISLLSLAQNLDDQSKVFNIFDTAKKLFSIESEQSSFEQKLFSITQKIIELLHQLQSPSPPTIGQVSRALEEVIPLLEGIEREKIEILNAFISALINNCVILRVDFHDEQSQIDLCELQCIIQSLCAKTGLAVAELPHIEMDTSEDEDIARKLHVAINGQ